MSASDERLTPAAGTLRKIFEQSTLHTGKWSSYFDVYERTLGRFAGRGITLVEVGVGGGGSLLMWRSYLQNARVIGVDIDARTRALTQPGVEIVIGDQASEAFWDRFYQSVGPIDVLIDDGGHTNEQQIVTVTKALPHVRDGGVILVEDIHASYRPEYLNPSRSSFISFAKHLVDGVNSRSPAVDWKSRYREVVSSLEFHESIVVIHVDRRRAREPHGDERCPELNPATATPPSGPLAKLQFVRQLPLAGPLAVLGVKMWKTAAMNRRLRRYFK